MAENETSKRFVPEMLVSLIERNTRKGKEGLEPSSLFLEGVCLLVDISGFTKLSGEFCDMGKSGIDELQLATNGYMAKLVEIIYSCGGDIIKFAGDAIICVFSASFVTSVSVKVRGTKLRRSMSSFAKLLLDADLDAELSGSDPSVANSPMDSNANSFISKPSMLQRVATARTVLTSDVVLRAMHCAELLRAVQTEKLSVHVAMSCGQMCFGILGGVDNRWECLISGPCIHELSGCLDDAPSKTAVISKKCAEIVLSAPVEFEQFKPESVSSTCRRRIITPEGGRFEIEILLLPSGNYRIVAVTNRTEVPVAGTVGAGAIVNNSNSLCTPNRTPNPIQEMPKKDNSVSGDFQAERQRNIAVQLVRQFVPVPIADEILGGTGLNFIAEIREVTTMFMKWDSYDVNGEHVDLISLQACFYQAQEELHSSGAYLRQFLVDDKGCVLIACWGMPHLSYLDNTSRALSAAAEIRRKLNKLDMSCSFGITTGDVYCGTVGSELRMEYAAIGSVVNMSARLMGKANGGILIDDATYFRLPNNLKELLLELDPIKVKGREEALTVYSYISNESVQVKEDVVEDHEIPAVCKDTLIRYVRRMAASGWKAEKSTLPKGKLGWRSKTSAIFAFRASRRSTSGDISTNENSQLRLVLLKGKEGSGRTTVVKWLRRQAQDRKIATHSIRIDKKESHIQYHVWKRLFQLMTPKGTFLSNDAQRSYVKALLSEIYPNGSHPTLKLAYDVLRYVLGVTCSFTVGLEKLKPGWMSRKHRSSKVPLTNTQIQDVLYQVFEHLMNIQTCLIILENVELADEASLRVLVELMNLTTQSGIVLTALEDTETEDSSRARSPFHHRAVLKQDAMNSSPWSRQYKETLQKHSSVKTVTLTNFTPEEIDRMLCARLNVSEVPAEVSQLVQDFSGGSYFWVREILQFITEHGAEQFMAAVNDDEPLALHPVAEYGHTSPKSSVHSATSTRVKTPMGPIRRTSSITSPTLRKSNSTRPHAKAASFRSPSASRSTDSPHQVQLDKLILCRFGNLSSDVQRILRTASIIGMTFDGSVLHGVLSVPLREQLVNCFQTLLNQRWLYQDLENEHMYLFAHPHAHQIIYELTPSSERSHIHMEIAEYMETTYKDDKTQYGLLSFHFQQCNPNKALMYAAKATEVLLQATTIYDFGDCIDLLTGSMPCCKTVFDVDVLLKLIQQSRSIIEDFHVRTTRFDHSGCLPYSFLWLFSCGVEHSSVVVPTTYGVPGSPTAEDSDPGEGFTGENVKQKPSPFKESGNERPTEMEDESDELKARRIFLQELDQLRNTLQRMRMKFSSSVAIDTAKPWQKEFLNITNDGAVGLIEENIGNLGGFSTISEVESKG